jgi:DNA polymerase-4
MVEGASIDEWYLDLGGTEAIYGHEPLADTAMRIRTAVIRETGLSVSLGGGTNKLIAKLAVERAKPKPGTMATGVHVVPAGGEAEFMRSVPLADIPMIGPKFQERLASLGMRTVPDVLQYDQPTLARWLGAREAAWLWERVRGVHDAPVEPHAETKSISRDETFPKDVADDAALERELLALVVRASSDLRAEGLRARTITVRIRDHDFTNRSAARTLPEGVVYDRAIFAVARELLRALRAKRRVPARLLSVALTGLAADPGADQLALFAREEPAAEAERDRKLARAVDALRARLGDRAIVPGSLSGK